MPREINARRYSGEGPIGLWPRKLERGARILDPECPWMASAGREERVFETFRDAVDYLYFETRGTQFREPATEQFETQNG